VLKVLACGIDVVAQEGTSRTAGGPVRPVHEVIDHELPTLREEIGQRHFARAIAEHIGFFNPDPRQRAALRGHFIAQARQLLFPREQRLACGQPRFPSTGEMVHAVSPSGVSA
jgi:hypothetical protein